MEGRNRPFQVTLGNVQDGAIIRPSCLLRWENTTSIQCLMIRMRTDTTALLQTWAGEERRVKGALKPPPSLLQDKFHLPETLSSLQPEGMMQIRPDFTDQHPLLPGMYLVLMGAMLWMIMVWGNAPLKAHWSIELLLSRSESGPASRAGLWVIDHHSPSCGAHPG